MKFRKRPVVIDAFQWQPDVPASDSPSWYREACAAQMIWGVLSGGCLIRSPDGTQFAKPGDWILRDSKGNLHHCKPDIFAATYEPADAHAPPLTQAAQDVLAERRRQVEVEGWTTGHDDQHVDGDLAVVAACYAISDGDEPPPMWPWDPSWWRPAGDRRNLVKAAALIIAEIERRDRAAARQATDVRNG